MTHNITGGICPLITAFDEIRTGGLSTEPTDDSAVVVLGGSELFVWNESEYWLATRMVAAARGRLEDAPAAFARLYPGGYADDTLFATIMRESPVVRQMTLLRPVLDALAARILHKVNSAAVRGQAINITLGTLPDGDPPRTTAEIPRVVNEYVDFINTLNVAALGTRRPSAIARMPDVTIQMYPRVPVGSLDEGLAEDKKIAAVGRLHEKVHAEASAKLSEVFNACKEAI